MSNNKTDDSDKWKHQLLQQLLRGDQEIAAGAGHDLDEVLADADALLNGAT